MPVSQEGMARLQLGIENARQWIEQKDTQMLHEVVSSYAVARSQVSAHFEALAQEMHDIYTSGGTLTPSQLYKMDRYTQLLSQMDTQINGAMKEIGQSGLAFMPDYMREAVRAAKDMTYMSFMDSEPVSKPGAALTVMGRWNDVPEDAVNAMIGATQTGVMQDLLRSVGKDTVKALSNTLTSGVITGRPIKQIAKDFHGKMDGSLARAATIVRTETLRAYREGTRQSYERNSDLVKGWAWRCARTTRCCSVCWAMDGQRFATNAMMHTHVNCRCFMVPVTPSWAELGFTGIKEAPAPVPAGLAFSKLSAEEQHKILGPGKYAAYKAGHIKLSDLAGYNVDPRWGGNRYERSLKDAIANKGKPIPGIVPMSKYGNVDLRPKEVPDNMKAAALPKPVSGVGLPWHQAKAKMEDLVRRSREGSTASDEEIDLEYDGRHVLMEVDRLKRGLKRAEDANDAFLMRIKKQDLADAEQRLAAIRTKLGQVRKAKSSDALSYEEARRLMQEEVLFAPEGHRSSLRPLIVNDKGPPKSVIQTGFDMFNKLVPGNPTTTFAQRPVVGIGAGRSNYGQFERDNPINMSRNRGAEVVTHELGHWLEHKMPGLHEDVVDFWQRRTAGVPLSHMGPGYDPGEMTRRDDFIHPYIGKEYKYSSTGEQYATEVVSMGLEYFHKDPQFLYENDPDMFEFIYKAVRGQTPNASRNSR